MEPDYYRLPLPVRATIIVLLSLAGWACILAVWMLAGIGF